MRYAILSELSLELLVLAVNREIGFGWRPLGGVAVSSGRWAQAMIKEEPNGGKIGHISIGGRYRVTLDGEDISSLCFEADDVEGYALCYVRGEDEGIQFATEERKELQQIRRTGQVQIERT